MGHQRFRYGFIKDQNKILIEKASDTRPVFYGPYPVEIGDWVKVYWNHKRRMYDVVEIQNCPPSRFVETDINAFKILNKEESDKMRTQTNERRA